MRTLFVAAALMFVAAPVSAGQKIAILEVTVEGGADPVVGRQMTARLAEVIARREGVTTIAPDDIRALLEKESEKQLLGCDDDSCLAEIGGMLGADVLVKGRVAKIEEGFALSINSVDARRAVPLGTVSDRWGGESIGLLEVVDPLVDRLFSKAPLFGAIEVTGAEDGSRIFVDDEIRGTAPAGQMSKIPVGARRVRVASEDHLPFERWVVVKTDKVTAVPVDLQDKPSSPFYATWWFWTATAVGVAGAAVGTAYLLGRDDGGTPGATGVNVAVDADAAFTGGR
ncbi:MAG: hypothetical protein RIT81_34210 [Deltaproteobacteria bacterium]